LDWRQYFGKLGHFPSGSYCSPYTYNIKFLTILVQMWIAKKEYDEHGPGIIENRAK